MGRLYQLVVPSSVEIDSTSDSRANISERLGSCMRDDYFPLLSNFVLQGLSPLAAFIFGRFSCDSMPLLTGADSYSPYGVSIFGKKRDLRKLVKLAYRYSARRVDQKKIIAAIEPAVTLESYGLEPGIEAGLKTWFSPRTKAEKADRFNQVQKGFKDFSCKPYESIKETQDQVIQVIKEVGEEEPYLSKEMKANQKLLRSKTTASPLIEAWFKNSLEGERA